MPIDLRSLKKFELSPAARPLGGNEPVTVIVKLKDGARLPAFVNARSEISAQIFTAELTPEQIRLLESDPNIESLSLSKRLGSY
jgi:hypothetical protein